MTIEEKKALGRFLDAAAGFLKSGYACPHEDYVFEDDAPVLEEKAFSSLPLAYTVEEPAEGPEEKHEEEKGAGIPGGGFLDSPNSLDSPDSLDSLISAVSSCTACPLGAARTRVVPGEGALHPLVMVIGEGPGAEEDASGRPFVGRAGQLLDRMLASIGLYRDKNCYITNVVKCRPPDNRDPAPEEIDACAPFLARQIALMKPLAILCAGRVAAQHILHTAEGINRLRGRFGEYPAAFEITETGTLQSASAAPVPVLPAYHPSALLRDESLKRPAFEDLKLLMAKLVSLDLKNLRDSGDPGYAAEVRPLLAKYAAGDEDFAVKVREYLEK
jgi:DNA polymerase